MQPNLTLKHWSPVDVGTADNGERCKQSKFQALMTSNNYIKFENNGHISHSILYFINIQKIKSTPTLVNGVKWDHWITVISHRNKSIFCHMAIQQVEAQVWLQAAAEDQGHAISTGNTKTCIQWYHSTTSPTAMVINNV